MLVWGGFVLVWGGVFLFNLIVFWALWGWCLLLDVCLKIVFGVSFGWFVFFLSFLSGFGVCFEGFG